jgi:single-stranded DNA-binding protein
MNTYSTTARLVADPDAPRQVGESSVTKFRVAVDGRVVKKGGVVQKDSQGRPLKKTCFWTCEAWGAVGENIGKFFRKGDPIALVGNFEQDEIETKDKGKQTYTTLKISDFSFTSGRADRADNPQDSAPQAPQQNQPPRNNKPAAPVMADDDNSDNSDIPF